MHINIQFKCNFRKANVRKWELRAAIVTSLIHQDSSDLQIQQHTTTGKILIYTKLALCDQAPRIMQNS